MTISEKAADVGQSIKADLAPQNAAHWARFVFAGSISLVGLVDIAMTRWVQNPPGGWEWQTLLMVFGGAGIVFTKSIAALAKAFLPWKSRNG
jgi:hypothetical protein